MISLKSLPTPIELATTLALFGIIAFASSPAQSQAEARFEVPCYPLAALIVAFHIAQPEAEQALLAGDDAQAYLRAYNNFPNQKKTSFTAESLFFVVFRDGSALIIAIEKGEGCTRFIVGPAIHQEILFKIRRNKT